VDRHRQRTTSDVIRVLLVDDQELVRSGLRRIFQTTDDIDVVGECEDGDQVAAAVREHEPAVVVMDVRMKRMDGVEATKQLRERDDAPPVLVLTTFDDDELLSAALRAGAAGFQLKDAPGEEIVRAVRTVADGEAWLDPGVTGRVLAAYRGTAPSRPAVDLGQLTARELEVLQLIGRGRSNSEIAAELFISEVTVKSHVGHIFTKLHLRDRAAAIVLAFDAGIVAPQS
jgi:DNA-binding NarL/FixJ family response regulator